MSLAHIVRSMASMAAIFATTHALAQSGPEDLAALCGDCRPVLYAHCDGFLEGPNFDAEGRLWAVDYRGGRVVQIADGACSTVVSTEGMPNGSRFHPDGRLFITDASRGLLIYDPRTEVLSTRLDTVAGKPLVGANDIVFDRAGGLYMTVRATSSVLHPDGMVIYLPPGDDSAPQVLEDALPFPNGIALSPDGASLYVGLYADKSIIVLPAADRPPPYLTSWTFARTEGGVGPDGMMTDGEGRLWWANFRDGAISVAGPKAHLIGRIALPAEAGVGTTNVTMRDGALYITEAMQGDIWRVPLTDAVTPLTR